MLPRILVVPQALDKRLREKHMTVATNTYSCDVVVIGAGISGLAAARELTDAGLSVKVVEARDRIGGRLYTRTNIANGPVELGAEFVHTAANPVRELLQRAGIGEKVGGSMITRSSEFREQLRAALAKLDRPCEALSVEELLMQFDEDAPEFSLFSEAFYTQSSREALRRTSAYDAVKELNLELEHGGEFMGEHNFRVTEGWGPLIELLATGVGIDTGRRVERVLRCSSKSGVTVEATSSDGRHVYLADQVVITVPLGVLKNGDIQFTPNLPTGKVEAIQSLVMLDILKLVFVFSDDVWDLDFSVSRPGLSPSAWWRSTWEGNESSETVIVGWAVADEARRMLQLTPDVMMDGALESLKELLGNPDLSPKLATYHSWNSDPFARGSYSHVPPGAPYEVRESLAAPTAGELFWAGEATAIFRPRTVGGGYTSGRRAAAEVIAARSF